MNTPLHSNEDVVQPKIYPGKYLATARQERGWSQEQVAGKLHLRVQVIDLLENDNYEALPESVFVQGYIKAYAKLLNIDIAPLIESYDVLKGPEKVSERILRQRKKEPQLRSYKTIWTVLAGSVIAIMLVVLGFGHKSDSVDAAPQTANNVQNTVDLIPSERPMVELRQHDINTSTNNINTVTEPSPKENRTLSIPAESATPAHSTPPKPAVKPISLKSSDTSKKIVTAKISPKIQEEDDTEDDAEYDDE